MLDFNNQVWARLSGPYEISNLGLVRNRKTRLVLKPYKMGRGYYVSIYTSWDQRMRKTRLISELLKEHFPDSKIELNPEWFEQVRLKYFKTKRPKSKPKFSRTCVDCGTGTNNYRCAACWTKRRDIGMHEEGVGYFSGRVVCGRKAW